MKRTLGFIGGILVFLVIVASSMPSSVGAFQTAAATPIYTMQSTQYGVFAVSESTGAITFCANTTTVPSTGGQAPIGVCKSIGTVAPTPTVNNSLSIAVSGISVFVFNTQTGQVSQCGGSGVVSGTTVTPVASCKALPKLT